jgi:hypothetical protein
MASKVKQFVDEQRQILAEQAERLRTAPGQTLRRAAAQSAQRVRSLQDPVRVVTHSGVKLTNLSHAALLDLMALQLEVVTSALSNAAAQLERVSTSDNVMDVVRGQAGELRATRERIVKDMGRAVAIVSDAGRGARNVATATYSKVVKPAQPRATKGPGRKPAAKRAVRKAKTKVRAKSKTRR